MTQEAGTIDLLTRMSESPRSIDSERGGAVRGAARRHAGHGTQGAGQRRRGDGLEDGAEGLERCTGIGGGARIRGRSPVPARGIRRSRRGVQNRGGVGSAIRAGVVGAGASGRMHVHEQDGGGRFPSRVRTESERSTDSGGLDSAVAAGRSEWTPSIATRRW